MERQRAWRWIYLMGGLFFLILLAGCFGGGGDGDDGGGGNGSGGGAVNTAPAPTAPSIETIEDTLGTSQISVNDPDAGQTHFFTIVTPPLGGTATVDTSGLVTYTPDVGFTEMDSLRVQVMDSGNPPQFGTVTIDVTVASVEMPATADDLAERVFVFPDGIAFDAGLADDAVTLTIGEFVDDTSSFTLVTQDGSAGGTVTIFPTVTSCTFAVEFSFFLLGDGPQIGMQIGIGPCTIDPRDGHLTLVNFDTGAVSVSNPPEALPDGPGDGTLIDEPFDFGGFRFDQHEVFVGDLGFCFLRVRITELTGSLHLAACEYLGLDSAGQPIAFSSTFSLLGPKETVVSEVGWGSILGPFECEDIVTLQFGGCS